MIEKPRQTRNVDNSKTLEDPILPKVQTNPKTHRKEPNTPAVAKSMLIKQESVTSTLKNTAKFGVIELDSIPVVDIDRTSATGDPNERKCETRRQSMEKKNPANYESANASAVKPRSGVDIGKVKVQDKNGNLKSAQSQPVSKIPSVYQSM